MTADQLFMIARADVFHRAGDGAGGALDFSRRARLPDADGTATEAADRVRGQVRGAGGVSVHLRRRFRRRLHRAVGDDRQRTQRRGSARGSAASRDWRDGLRLRRVAAGRGRRAHRGGVATPLDAVGLRLHADRVRGAAHREPAVPVADAWLVAVDDRATGMAAGATAGVVSRAAALAAGRIASAVGAARHRGDRRHRGNGSDRGRFCAAPVFPLRPDGAQAFNGSAAGYGGRVADGFWLARPRTKPCATSSRRPSGGAGCIN